jgi:hypothetical protein
MKELSQLGSRSVFGRTLEQWQYEVTSGGRIWYCPDSDRRITWLSQPGPSIQELPSRSDRSLHQASLGLTPVPIGQATPVPPMPQ